MQSSKRRQPTDTWLDHREDLHIASDRVQRGIVPSLAQHPLSQTGISFFAAAERCARLGLAASQSPIKLPISTPCLGARPAPGRCDGNTNLGLPRLPRKVGKPINSPVGVGVCSDSMAAQLRYRGQGLLRLPGARREQHSRARPQGRSSSRLCRRSSPLNRPC
jgi:hypothetical protein